MASRESNPSSSNELLTDTCSRGRRLVEAIKSSTFSVISSGIFCGPERVYRRKAAISSKPLAISKSQNFWPPTDSEVETQTCSPQRARRPQWKTNTKEHSLAEPQPKPFTTEATEEHGGKPKSKHHRRGRIMSRGNAQRR